MTAIRDLILPLLVPTVAWLNFAVPFLAVLGAYLIALHQEVAVACFPFIEGCTSISRAARYGDALFWFRGLMMPLSMLLVFYWICQWRWLNQYAGYRKRHTVVLWLGVISALALVLYANYLGSPGDFYRFMRQFGVTFYFAFALLAQLISVQSLRSAHLDITPRARHLLQGQLAVVVFQWILGLFSLWFTITQPDYKFQADNILEWNFGLAMITFYALSGWLWRELPLSSYNAVNSGSSKL